MQVFLHESDDSFESLANVLSFLSFGFVLVVTDVGKVNKNYVSACPIGSNQTFLCNSLPFSSYFLLPSCLPFCLSMSVSEM